MPKFFIVCLVITISGCALLNPHVAPKVGKGKVDPCPAVPQNLESALGCANAWSETYKSALISQAKLPGIIKSRDPRVQSLQGPGVACSRKPGAVRL